MSELFFQLDKFLFYVLALFELPLIDIVCLSFSENLETFLCKLNLSLDKVQDLLA